MKNSVRYLICLLTVPTVYIIIKWMFHGPNEIVYAGVSAWWFSLYVFSLMKFKLKDWPAVALVCFIHCFLFHIGEYSDLYWDFRMFAIIVMGMAFLQMPAYLISVFINYLIRKFFPKHVEEK